MNYELYEYFSWLETLDQFLFILHVYTTLFNNDFLDLFSVKLINVQSIRLHKTKDIDLCYY